MMEMTEEEKEKYKKNPNIMLKIAGKSYRCPCGCNVFHHPDYDLNKFKCNSCGNTFIAE